MTEKVFIKLSLEEEENIFFLEKKHLRMKALVGSTHFRLNMDKYYKK